MNIYLKTLLEYFVDGSPLDTLELQALIDNDLVVRSEFVDRIEYSLTSKASGYLKNRYRPGQLFGL